MKTKNYFLMLTAALMFIVVSCGKKGDPGPAGAAGTQGANGSKGDKGDTGATGPKGDTGTANVIYSDWYRPTTYAPSSLFGLTHLNADIAAPKITQAVLDNSVVIVYGKMLGYSASIWPVTQVSELPIVLNYVEGGSQVDTWSANVTVGKITIDFVNNSNHYTTVSNAHQYRYVIIPGAVKAASSVNLRNYNAVKAAFNLKD